MFYDLQKRVFGDMQIGEVQMDSQRLYKVNTVLKAM